MIVKVQRPLDGPGEILVYDKRGTIYQWFTPSNPLRLFEQNEYKQYRHATKEKGIVVLGARAKEQDW